MGCRGPSKKELLANIQKQAKLIENQQKVIAQLQSELTEAQSQLENPNLRTAKSGNSNGVSSYVQVAPQVTPIKTASGKAVCMCDYSNC